jgi:hypothetical protein
MFRLKQTSINVKIDARKGEHWSEVRELKAISFGVAVLKRVFFFLKNNEPWRKA